MIMARWFQSDLSFVTKTLELNVKIHPADFYLRYVDFEFHTYFNAFLLTTVTTKMLSIIVPCDTIPNTYN